MKLIHIKEDREFTFVITESEVRALHYALGELPQRYLEIPRKPSQLSSAARPLIYDFYSESVDIRQLMQELANKL